MATVVLLGCSTTGKTTAARRMMKTSGMHFEVIDTDSLVASDEEFKGHLYAMFLKFTKDGDTSAPQLFLELGERALLIKLKEKRESVLIAAGPNVPLREPEWSAFLRAVQPICVYFRLSAGELYEGLKKRRERQKRRGMDLCPGFGCWDNGLATRYNAKSGEWDELSKDEAIPLIEQHIARVEPVYMAACEPQHVFDVGECKHDQVFQDRLNRVLVDCLRWKPMPVSWDYTFQSASQFMEHQV